MSVHPWKVYYSFYYRPLIFRGYLPTKYRRKNHKCDRYTAKIVWSIFLGNGVTERKKKSTVAKIACVTGLFFFCFVKSVSRKIGRKFRLNCWYSASYGSYCPLKAGIWWVTSRGPYMNKKLFQSFVLESVKNSIHENSQNTYPYSPSFPVSQRAVLL